MNRINARQFEARALLGDTKKRGDAIKAYHLIVNTGRLISAIKFVR